MKYAVGDYEFAKQKIALAHDTCGFEKTSKLPAELIWEEFKHEPNRFKGLFLFIDEALYHLRFITYYFVSAIVHKENSDSKNIVYELQIFESIIQSLSSIRLLCSVGNDVNARQILRYLIELVFVLHSIKDSMELADEFFRVENYNDGNVFWHKYISKGKMLKALRARHSGGTRFAFFEGGSGSYLDGIIEKLSASSHPTGLGVGMAASEWSDREGRDGYMIFGNTQYASRFTISASMYIVAAALFFREKFEYSSVNHLNPSYQLFFSDKKEYVDYINTLQKLFVALWMGMQPVLAMTKPSADE